MCGIAGYIGSKNAPDVLFDMLKRLEYRGYDSAGIAFYSDGQILVPKDSGKVDDVRASLKPENFDSKIGLGHTRWATHGRPSKINSHPHPDCTGDFVVAHNGIIENYLEIKAELEERGHRFRSETDSEVVAHLIEDYYDGSLMDSFPKVMARLKGSYALVALSKHEPKNLVFARSESPLLIGVGEGEAFIASDAPAFMGYTKKMIVLEDGDYGQLTKDKCQIHNLKDRKKVKRPIKKITWALDEAEKSGFQHFMLKEIYEEPQAAKNAQRDRKMMEAVAKKILKKKMVYFLGCGTAYHAGLYGKYLFERMGIRCDAVIASEFRYSTVESVDEHCALISVSQSGETADTLAAVKMAKAKGAYTAAIVNVVGSSITRLCDDVVYTHSGPEIAVASTKAYIGQLVAIAVLALESALLADRISKRKYQTISSELGKLGDLITKVIKANHVRDIAEQSATVASFFFLGRRQNFPTALEGALKLKEISYVHAEGYAAGELKHGPLALMNEDVTVIAIVPDDDLKSKMESNIQEVKARSAKVLTVGVGCDIEIPKTHPLISPILAIVPLHLFAYYISVLKGLDPDKPRNLAKSVTVE